MKFYTSCHNCSDESLEGPFDSVDEAISVGLQHAEGNISTHGYDIIPCYDIGEYVDID